MPSGRLDPWRAVERGAHFEGAVPFVELPRLVDLLQEREGCAAYRFDFVRDEQRRAVVKGKVSARLTLLCQRCMGPCSVEIASSVALALVSGIDEAERLPDSLDPLLVREDNVLLADLVEDELLLALPQIPMHAPGECAGAAPMSEEPATDESDASGTRRDNPFAVLADWKKEG